MKDTILKFFYFLFCLIISTLIVILICFIEGKVSDTDLLFNYIMTISIFSSFIAICVWSIKYKSLFEKLIIFFCILFFNMLVIYIGPLTTNRSLSTFVYFYAVEKNEVNKNLYDESYYKDFVYRRYLDGDKMGFLTCDESKCKPNIRTKIFYYILYPLSKITASDKHYKEFRKFADDKS